MLRRSTLLGALLLFACSSLALALPESWVNFYGQPFGSAAEGGTGAYSMAKSFDGGWLWLSNDLNPQPTQPNHNNCCAVVVTKVSSAREVEYQTSFTSVFGGGGLYPHAILEDSSHAAVFATNIVNNPWVVKLDSNGNVAWNRVSYGDANGFFTEGLAIAQTGDADYVVAGAWQGPNASNAIWSWAALVGIDADDGHGLWAKYYPTDSSAVPSHAVAVVRTSPDNGYAIAANYTTGTDGMFRLIRTDSAGVPTFDKAYHIAGQSWVPSSVLQLSDGTFILAGNSFGAGAIGNLVLHLNTDGSIAWQKIYFTTFNFLGDVAETADHNVVFAGADNNSGSIYKISAANGALMWAKQFTSPGFNFQMRFTGVVGEADGSVTVAGSGANYPDTVIGDALLHVGPNGEFVGCLLGERTSTADVVVSNATATVITLNSATVSIATVANTPPPGFGISAADITTVGSACSTVFPAGLTPVGLGTDVHATGNSNGNGVFEPGETINAETTWHNTTGAPLDLHGFTPQFQDDDGASLPAHGTADFGVVANGASADCFTATGECYQFGLSLSVARPSLHWDIGFDETLNDSYSLGWLMHIGNSFADVPTSDNFYRFIETVLHNGVTAGCGGGNYCKAQNTTRAQMAVFLLKGMHGGAYVPPACSATLFTDVPCPGGPNVNWVNQLVTEGVTAGCGGGLYCPSNPVSRGAMAVFLLKGEHGGAYVAPACSATVFTDEPCPGGPFVNWVNKLVEEGITAGCGGSLYCPGNPVTRGQMAVFLTKTFKLLLNSIRP